MAVNNIGRPSFLEQHGLTIHDLLLEYARLGSYEAVATKYHTTTRTIGNYLAGKVRIGRPRGSYTSKARQWVDNHITCLRDVESVILAAAKDDGISSTYMHRILYEKRLRVRDVVIRRVKDMLRQHAAIRDTRGRYIPTEAIKYVWLPKWKFDRPVFVRVVLRDNTKAKLPTLVIPTVEDALE